MRAWRLISDGPRSAAGNMAVDEAILRSCAIGDSPPTLRIYSWERPAISLGYSQALDSRRIDLDYCREAGIDVVRRITGGRAVVHGSDLTFSIALAESDLPRECHSILASHQWLMGGIAAGLRLLGVEAEIGPENACKPGTAPGADCFAHVADCDIRVGRDKVVGSAQVRRWGGLLEQGSIPCASPGIDTARVFGKPTPTSPFLPDGLSFQVIADAISRGFGRFLEMSPEPAALSEQELQVALQLVSDKYASFEWTSRSTSESPKSGVGSRAKAKSRGQRAKSPESGAPTSCSPARACTSLSHFR